LTMSVPEIHYLLHCGAPEGSGAKGDNSKLMGEKGAAKATSCHRCGISSAFGIG